MTNLLELQQLSISFSGRTGSTVAVDRVDLRVDAGQTLAVVGESGCGKSTTALAIMQLLPKSEAGLKGGRILYKGEDLTTASEERMQQVRGAEIAMIFQEPMSALNPVLTVGYQIAEVLQRHRKLSRKQCRTESIKLLVRVGIPDAASRARDYPHRLSGGMRQRVMIAMAIACRPSVLIADEPTTALDVTIQKQILDLLRELQAEQGLGIMIITHDLGVVAEMADRVAVMYAGRKVEEASATALFSNPRHPYTRGLLGALPDAIEVDEVESDTGPLVRPRLAEVPGTVPRLAGGEVGCVFANRCPIAEDRCARESPAMLNVGTDHQAACFFAEREPAQ